MLIAYDVKKKFNLTQKNCHIRFSLEGGAALFSNILGVEVNAFASLSLCIDHSSVVTPALNGLTAMNIRYTSLHPTGQIWWASLTRLCGDKHSAAWVSVWASEIKKSDCGFNITSEWMQRCRQAHAETYTTLKKDFQTQSHSKLCVKSHFSLYCHCLLLWVYALMEACFSVM